MKLMSLRSGRLILMRMSWKKLLNMPRKGLAKIVVLDALPENKKSSGPDRIKRRLDDSDLSRLWNVGVVVDMILV